MFPFPRDQIRKAAHHLAARRARARSRRALSGLNAHLLHDIGLEAADIEGVVQGRLPTSLARGQSRVRVGTPRVNPVPAAVATVHTDTPAFKAA